MENWDNSVNVQSSHQIKSEPSIMTLRRETFPVFGTRDDDGVNVMSENMNL